MESSRKAIILHKSSWQKLHLQTCSLVSNISGLTNSTNTNIQITSILKELDEYLVKFSQIAKETREIKKKALEQFSSLSTKIEETDQKETTINKPFLNENDLTKLFQIKAIANQIEQDLQTKEMIRNVLNNETSEQSLVTIVRTWVAQPFLDKNNNFFN
ncbi:hypothetical protein M0813_09127 [Anaeramoeba flamelloides]|uniref:Uncharacterized protein n=1 Tax=Anaeramoeba flamelloides TaxID=1746091 RepID=A0AAV7YDZ6_9EUKA|nr:hypothetical protein M0812_28779 [Anaeramoeba flamelloides]KAJ6228298.1 hypothetical protein M0813_09127 [Anaeramoeba flamelloides]